METFLASLVFCEAPGLDVVAYAGTTSSVAAAVKKVSSIARSGGRVEPPPSEPKKDGVRKDGKAPRRLRAAYSPAFDGLNLFETIVMH
uniref:Uncharacterized protein n=1 Tax=Oryza punctata TaxID=4537 RepID=A0A0E0L7D8_ORYPU